MLASVQVSYLRFDACLLILELTLKLFGQSFLILFQFFIECLHVFGTGFLVGLQELLALCCQRFLIFFHLLLEIVEVDLFLLINVKLLLHFIKELALEHVVRLQHACLGLVDLHLAELRE